MKFDNNSCRKGAKGAKNGNKNLLWVNPEKVFFAPLRLCVESFSGFFYGP
jgi:hypothetical protein